MKTNSIIIGTVRGVITMLFLFLAMKWGENHPRATADNSSPAIPTRDPTSAIANSYFRMGEQAALIARGRQDEIEEHIRRKYASGAITNKSDWEAISNPLDVIDDPRIFAVVRELNGGSVLGLDTNAWGNATNIHIWTVLKD